MHFTLEKTVLRVLGANIPMLALRESRNESTQNFLTSAHSNRKERKKLKILFVQENLYWKGCTYWQYAKKCQNWFDPAILMF